MVDPRMTGAPAGGGLPGGRMSMKDYASKRDSLKRDALARARSNQ